MDTAVTPKATSDKVSGCDLPGKVAASLFGRHVLATCRAKDLWRFTKARKWQSIADSEGMLADMLTLTGGLIPRQRLFHEQFRMFMGDLGKEWSHDETTRACYHLRQQCMYLLRKKRDPGTPPKQHKGLQYLMDMLRSTSVGRSRDATSGEGEEMIGTGSSSDLEVLSPVRLEMDCIELSSEECAATPVDAGADGDIDVASLESSLFHVRRRVTGKTAESGQPKGQRCLIDDELDSLLQEAIEDEDRAPL